jgi:nucleoside-diphosphate kinase
MQFVSPTPFWILSPAQGKDACKEGRKMLGATLPSDSAMGTIRGDYCLDVGRNVVHGSDSVDSAQKEIALWFPEGVAAYESCQKAWVYE